MCISLQRLAFQNVQLFTKAARRAQKCMKHVSDVRGQPRYLEIIVLPQFWASDILKKGSIFEEQPFSQQTFSADFLSSSSQQLFSAALLSSSSQQPSSAIILLWSRFGGQLLSSSCCGQWLAVNYDNVLWKNPLLRFREKTHLVLESESIINDSIWAMRME